MSNWKEKPDEFWKKQLTPEEFEITRKGKTERAFTGKYWNSKEAGIYKCVCCGQALFDSETKYDSGSGWPSFWKPIEKTRIETQKDNSLAMTRVEIHCSHCGAHLGHVFEDGPEPSGLRFCVNSASLKLEKK